MQKKTLINYWNNFYKEKKKFKESSFARFVIKKIRAKKQKDRLIDIGCGNGRDSIFFNKKRFKVTAIDISKKAIKKNSLYENEDLNFINFDIEKNTMDKKFDFIYCRFFLHTINNYGENKLLNLIKKIKKKQTLIFFEFRNIKDEIFKKKKKLKHNEIVEFEKGHYRRIIDPKIFIKKFERTIGCKYIYLKSSKNLSIYKKDNPNLSRIIFKV